MSCDSCGRPKENGRPTHWLGCEVPALKAKVSAAKEAPPAEADSCEHGECSEPKKEWSGRGARPKYCADGHK